MKKLDRNKRIIKDASLSLNHQSFDMENLLKKITENHLELSNQLYKAKKNKEKMNLEIKEI